MVGRLWKSVFTGDRDGEEGLGLDNIYPLD